MRRYLVILLALALAAPAPAAAAGLAAPAPQLAPAYVQPVQLLLPWSCGVCAAGQADIGALSYPEPDVWDVLFPFKWSLTWLWNEGFRPLICWLLAIGQGMLNAASAALNLVMVPGINSAIDLLMLLILRAQDMFLAVWAFLAWMRLTLWSIYAQLVQIGPALTALAHLVAAAFELVGSLLQSLVDLVGGIIQIIAYLTSLLVSIASAMVDAVINPTPAPQIAQITDFFLFVWFIDIFRAIADSSLWWAYTGFIGITYLRFGIWMLEELSALNQ